VGRGDADVVTAGAARDRDRGRADDLDDRLDPVVEPWPRGISRQATMRISDVLRELGAQFPAVSHSKLRFLEEQGLIEPVRTAAGYRQYSPADVERLRFVLTEQRDSYLPLKVIKERLAAMDAGEDAEHPAPRLAGDDAPARRRWTIASVADVTGTEERFVEDLVKAGLLVQEGGGRLAPGSVDVVRLAAALAEYGIEPRHLRTFRTAADRQVALADQVVAPWRSQQSSAARGQAATMAAEIGELFARLHATWVRQGVADLA
jgi:DNA-binding transcriptional MerR regulator